MAVKKDYAVDGMSTSEVRELQKSLGVAQDGLWGNKSQAALDAAYGRGADPYAVYTGAGRQSGGKSYSGGSTGGSTGGYTGGPTHSSGYTGAVVTGANGRSYTDYGSLLRDDGFFYPAGAKISANGMYYDAGQGWQFAKQAVAFDGYGNMLGYTPGSMTGAAPGARVTGFEGLSRSAGYAGGADAGAQQPGNQQGEEEQPASLWEQYFEEQLRRYQEQLLAGYGR